MQAQRVTTITLAPSEIEEAVKAWVASTGYKSSLTDAKISVVRKVKDGVTIHNIVVTVTEGY